jgi:hypothetical protein
LGDELDYYWTRPDGEEMVMQSTFREPADEVARKIWETVQD